MKGIYEKIPFRLSVHRNRDREIIHSVFHFHNSYEILLSMEGNVRFYVEQTSYTCVPGMLLLLNPQEVHKGTITDDGVYSRCGVHFDADLLRPFLGEETDLLFCFNGRNKGQNNAILLKEEEIREFMELFDKLEQLQNEEAFGKNILQITYLVQMLVMINRMFSGMSLEAAKPVPALITKIMEYVEAHLHQPMALEEIADALYISKYYMCHQFKKATGDSLYHFILVKRITLARRLLMEGKSVAEACEQSGFNNYNNFIRTFQKYAEMPPGEYRRRYFSK